MSDEKRDHTPEDAEALKRERPFSEFRDEGLLWLVNRVVFHPRGYALAFQVEDDGSVTGWTMIGDGEECWTFTNEDDDDGFAKVREFFA